MAEYFFVGFASGYLACVLMAGLILRGYKVTKLPKDHNDE